MRNGGVVRRLEMVHFSGSTSAKHGIPRLADQDHNDVCHGSATDR